jgi:hypothetical protein
MARACGVSASAARITLDDVARILSRRWPAVLAVADALKTRGRLDGKTVHEIVSAAPARRLDADDRLRIATTDWAPIIRATTVLRVDHAEVRAQTAEIRRRSDGPRGAGWKWQHIPPRVYGAALKAAEPLEDRDDYRGARLAQLDVLDEFWRSAEGHQCGAKNFPDWTQEP